MFDLIIFDPTPAICTVLYLAKVKFGLQFLFKLSFRFQAKDNDDKFGLLNSAAK